MLRKEEARLQAVINKERLENKIRIEAERSWITHSPPFNAQNWHTHWDLFYGKDFIPINFGPSPQKYSIHTVEKKLRLKKHTTSPVL